MVRHLGTRSRRYLSAREKSELLESWFHALTSMPWQASDAQGDQGQPDADMVPWCIRLNRLRGLCTVQSCAGHRLRDSMSSGHVWLRLDQQTFAQFDRHASELARAPTVDRVERVYGADGQDLAVVTFQGNERGSLTTSMESICSFFERLAGGR